MPEPVAPTIVATFPLALNFMGGVVNPSVPVNAASAIGVPAFWSGCRLISETTASLPAVVRRRAGGTAAAVPDHPVAALLNGQAAPGVLGYTVRQVWALHAAATGNGYLRVERDNRGNVTALRNLDPSTVRPYFSQGEKWFEVKTKDGTETLDASECAHIHLLSFDGLKGLDPVATLAGTFDLANLIDRFSRNFLRKGAHSAGVIEFQAGATADQIATSKANWRALSGVDNAGETPALVNATYRPVGASNKDADLAELRRLIIQDIAAILRVPPALLYSFQATTNSNAEQQSAEVVTFGLRNWIEQMEAALTAALLTTADRAAGLEIDLDVGELLRADPVQRAAQIMALCNSGILTPNEGRAILGYPGYPGGDTPRVPVAVSQPMGGTATGGATSGAA